MMQSSRLAIPSGLLVAADEKLDFSPRWFVPASIFMANGVNIAARLEAIAEPGGIRVSDKVHREIRGKVDVFARDIGLQTLKNIAEPVRVYEFALAAIKPRLEDLGGAPSSFAWPPKDKPNAEPYPACRHWVRTMPAFSSAATPTS